MGNSTSSVYDDTASYSAPVAYPVVEPPPPTMNTMNTMNTSIPKQQPQQQPMPITTRVPSKGIAIKQPSSSSSSSLNRVMMDNRIVQSSYQEPHSTQPVKIIILGKQSVGKASFVNGSTKSSPEKGSTISYTGTETVFRTMQIKKQCITFHIVMVNDDMYLDGDLFYDAVGVFLMYDTTNRESYHAIESVYLPFIKRCCPYSLTKVLIASKVDGWSEVTPDEGKLLALMNHMQYCEVSTKDNINLMKPFTHVAEAIAKSSVAYSI